VRDVLARMPGPGTEHQAMICTCNAVDCGPGAGHESYCGQIEPAEMPVYFTRDQADDAASRHRGQRGDDVVLHDAEDYGSLLVCEDCGWTVTYVPDDESGAEGR
jgi:hypothetical protein